MSDTTPDSAHDTTPEPARTLREQVAALEHELRFEAGLGSSYERGKGRDEAMLYVADKLDALLHAEAAPAPDVRGSAEYRALYDARHSRPLDGVWLADVALAACNLLTAFPPAPPDGGTPETR